jgi:5-methyltetrahydrofolate--homocysteine methyltransferase
MSDFESIQNSIINGNSGSIVGQVNALIEAGADPQEILDEGLLAGMAVVGERFKRNEMFLPQVLMAAQAMQAAIDRIKPLLVGSAEGKTGPSIVIGTVKGDMHDIGKNLLKIMLVGAGYEVVDLGVNVAPERFKEAAIQNSAPIVCLSALLSSTMNQMRAVVDLFQASPELQNVKILVGGAPLNSEFAREIGAHGYAPAAPQGVDLVRSLI